MIINLTILLGFQLIGEVAARALSLTLPGPVLGMTALFLGCIAVPRLAATMMPTTNVLLAHLSLLFVPAGVGVVGHLDKFGSDGMALGLAIAGSTVLAIIAGVLTFIGVRRLTGAQ